MTQTITTFLASGPFQTRAFVSRALGYALAALMGGVALHARQAPHWQWALMLSFGLWPPISFWLTRRASDRQRAERRNYLADAVLSGVMLPLMAFNLFPCAALLMVTMLDKLSTRLRGLLLQSLPCYAAGAVLGTVLVQPVVRLDTPMAVEVATLPFLMLYYLAMLSSYWRKRRVLGEQAARLERAVQEDAQTGLLTRDSWIGKAASALAFHHSRDTPSSIVLIDLDRFSQVNLSFGHDAADEYLRAVGDQLRLLARQGTVMGRYGTDQFALLLPATRLVEAEVAAQRFHTAIQDLRLPDWPGLACTARLSVATSSIAYPGIREWLGAAEAALYRAKQGGGNRIDLAM